MTTSERFGELIVRLDALKSHLLPKFDPLGIYSVLELDLIRAYLVLCHAEVESYLEDIAAHLKEIVSVELNTSTGLTSFELADARVLLKETDNRIKRNHGLKQENLYSLFEPFGFTEEEFASIDPKFTIRMSDFGLERGRIAHSTAMRLPRATSPPDAKRAATLVDEIQGYLKGFDNMVQKRRLRGIVRQYC